LFLLSPRVKAGAPRGSSLSIVSAPALKDPSSSTARSSLNGRGILALAHRGVTHVRGKDCVHPDIGRVVVKDDLFSCPRERTTGA